MSREYDGWDCGGHRARHGSYDEYDHSDQEVYVFDQCCKNCRYYNDCEFCCNRHYGSGFKKGTDWCMDWKGKGSHC